MRLAARTMLLLLIAAAGCGGSSTAPSSNTNNPPPTTSPPATPTNTTSISIGNNFFDPAATTVPVGSKITWTWNTCGGDGYGGQVCGSHSVMFDDGTASGSQSEGTWSRTFAAAGTYKYHCLVHGSSMSGTIVVQ